MKKAIRLIILTVFIITASCLLNTVSAEDPPSPPIQPAGGDEPIGGGAPIGGGLFILLGLGAAYGGVKGYKFYQGKKKSLLD